MRHSSAEAIEGVERVERAGHAPGTTATETDAARLRSGAHPADDGMYPTKEDKASSDRDSLRKLDLESNDTDEVKVAQEEVVRGEEEDERQPGKIKQFMAKYRKEIRIASHVLFGVVMTGWWIAGLVLHRSDYGWLIPFLLWLFIMIRLVTFYVPSRYALIPVAFLWKNIVQRVVYMIPPRFRLPLGAIGTIAVILVGTMVTEETADNTRSNRAISCFGLLVFIFVFWATSKNRKMIKWHTVIVGMLVQFILAVFVLRTKAGYDIFNFIAYLAKTLLGFANKGTIFLTNEKALTLNWFLFNVIPPIVFFIALVQLLYYLGALQFFISKFAHLFFYTMHVSGAEAVVAAASPFVGQGESAVLIRPFIPHLTDAELHQVMTSGFATIAGSVLAAYIFMGINPQALISSCVMSIPASLAISKLRYPETEEPLTAGRIVVPAMEDEERPSNALHAFANGGWLGLKVAGMIVASLLCILSLLGVINAVLTWWGHYLNIGSFDPKETKNLTIEFVLGYLFYPVSFLLGVDRNGDDILLVSKLIGMKIITNEFVAFSFLTSDPSYANLSPRSRLIATYALCGFGNISSVGIQIGVLSQLAPGKGGRVAKVAFSALLSGIVSTLTSASIAGMLVSDQATLFKASDAA
ncbi:hypothetical protein V496_06746 [Pseudogymnoascus sp. VKM F-4515 (FW-2607)]|nr:hypothetical protein V496_06746 [Pseudogymnoascus sp. VKM F-4515 (FW-2607)]KFY88654.1 hypothetical protein V498_06702 [Pseudogymnoascus sp. VKM F-4517 (FW-2822)]